MKVDIVKTSKFLSLVLRHNPSKIDLILDAQGWANVEDLLEKMNRNRFNINRQDLELIVEENNKQRFSFSEDGSMIRANQGHSISIDLELEAVKPPVQLYHGTASKTVSVILKDGLKKMKRQHVHLSDNLDTATNVGGRHGKPVVLVVESRLMYKDGFEFYCSDNGVWLTDRVPAKYLELLEELLSY